ncbi:hypothetical protein [Streptomyces sp. NPDC056938]
MDTKTWLVLDAAVVLFTAAGAGDQEATRGASRERAGLRAVQIGLALPL